MTIITGVMALLALAFATWRACDLIFAMGELHGRYLTEQTIGENLRAREDDLAQCRNVLSATQVSENACENALLDCGDGARYTRLTLPR